MEGYGAYPPSGGYPNNQRNSFQYPNQYHAPAQPGPNHEPQPQPQPQPQPPHHPPVASLYHPQQPQQFTHQAYQPPSRQLRSSYPGGMPPYDQMGPQPGQFQQGVPPQQPYPGTFQASAYQPPPQSVQSAPQIPLDAPGEPDPPPRPSRPVPNIPIKTKFPVARIKRIMQADEDVGKVAQVTPVIVSKALELFMVSLVTKAAEQAKTRGSKRITAGHLKAAVVSEEQFDFLTEIISKAPDIPSAAGESSGAAKALVGGNGGVGFDQAPANMNNIIEEDGAQPKKGRRGRKKKVSSDDEDS